MFDLATHEVSLHVSLALCREGKLIDSKEVEPKRI